MEPPPTRSDRWLHRHALATQIALVILDVLLVASLIYAFATGHTLQGIAMSALVLANIGNILVVRNISQRVADHDRSLGLAG